MPRGKKEIKIPKEKLEELYIKHRLSTYEIGNIYNCYAKTIWRKLVKYNIPRRKKYETVNETNRGRSHPNWKGGKSMYQVLHRTIRSIKEEPKYCTICNEYGKKLHLCSIDHTYTTNPNDYIYLCNSCHKVFDNCRKELNNHSIY